MALNRPPRSANILSFLMLGQYVELSCSDLSLMSVILAKYEPLAVTLGDRLPDLQYIITGNSDSNAFSLVRRGQASMAAADVGELLFLLEKDVTVALQERRPDLLFLHAAALEHRGKAYLLAGASGNGKSTTAWGLLHHGFRYLSDELSPIDLNSLYVLPYPRALCLKRAPPAAYPLPTTDVLDFGGSIHVPVRALPAAAFPEPCELAGIFFVHYREDLQAPVLQAIGATEGGARMYITALNALAHPSHGLDAVLHIAQRIPCYCLESADLRSTCEAISRIAERRGQPAATEAAARN